MLTIVQRKLPFYRKKLFEKLSKKKDINLILLFKTNSEINLAGKSKVTKIKYKQVIGFYFLDIIHLKKLNISSIIVEGDLRFFPFFIYLIASRKYKIFIWGLWKTKNKIANLIRTLLIYFVNGAIFYSRDHLKSFSKFHKKDKLILALNTLYVSRKITEESKHIEFKSRDSFIFVGSLNKRKNVEELIKIWYIFKKNKKISPNIKLNIIGNGDQEKNIKYLVKNYKLGESINFLGNINDVKLLKKYYFKSFASISMGQSGLSVVQAILHGVPFICLKNCHSGGEIDNIINNETGFKCENSTTILKIIEEISLGKHKNIYKKTANYAKVHLDISNYVKALLL